MAEALENRFQDLNIKEKAQRVAEVNYDESKQKHYLQGNAITICSWNFDPGDSMNANDKRVCLLDTLEAILPSVVLLQETVWVSRNVQRRMLEHEPEDLYAVVGHEFRVVGSETEVSILYKPDCVEVDEGINNQIWLSWADLVREILPGLVGRTITLAATVSLFPNEENAKTAQFIFISAHLPGSHSGFTEDQRRDFSDRLLVSAKRICNDYRRFVIIGADWNCPVDNLNLPVNSFMPLPTDQNGEFYFGGVDSIIFLAPDTRLLTPALRNMRLFYWDQLGNAPAEGAERAKQYNEVFGQGGKHRPRLCELSSDID